MISLEGGTMALFQKRTVVNYHLCDSMQSRVDTIPFCFLIPRSVAHSHSSSPPPAGSKRSAADLSLEWLWSSSSSCWWIGPLVDLSWLQTHHFECWCQTNGMIFSYSEYDSISCICEDCLSSQWHHCVMSGSTGTTWSGYETWIWKLG